MKKFKFGRNLASFLIIIGSLLFIILVVFLIYWPIEANNQKKKYDVTPFLVTTNNDDRLKALSSYSVGTKPDSCTYTFNYKDVVKSPSKFDKLDVDFSCSKYHQDGNSATFTLKLKWNQNTTALVNSANGGNGTLNPDSSGYTVYAFICLASDEVGFISYSTSSLKYKLLITDTSEASRTTTIKGIKYFPKNINSFPMMWPFNSSKSAPDAFVLIHFGYYQSGKFIEENHILKYSYKEYVNDSTEGGIQ